MDVYKYIDSAIKSGKSITIKYVKYNGTQSKRTISNLQYSDEYGKGYITGYCHLRKENRTFKISRIKEIDGYSLEKKEGCYIATMVYGDYNHPQVLVLRRFRDEKLSTTPIGELFIKIYYLISPKLVHILKGHKKINIVIRKILDTLISWIN